jgi:hypothetical protein
MCYPNLNPSSYTDALPLCFDVVFGTQNAFSGLVAWWLKRCVSIT